MLILTTLAVQITLPRIWATFTRWTSLFSTMGGLLFIRQTIADALQIVFSSLWFNNHHYDNSFSGPDVFWHTIRADWFWNPHQTDNRFSFNAKCVHNIHPDKQTRSYSIDMCHTYVIENIMRKIKTRRNGSFVRKDVKTVTSYIKYYTCTRWGILYVVIC